jgi:hypothetical protein
MASIFSGVRHIYHISFAQDAFALRLSRFRYFINGSLPFTSLQLICLQKGFSLSVHHQIFTSPAAQGDLTTLPDIALPMGLYPSSVKNFMAQTKGHKVKIRS